MNVGVTGVIFSHLSIRQSGLSGTLQCREPKELQLFAHNIKFIIQITSACLSVELLTDRLVFRVADPPDEQVDQLGAQNEAVEG